MRNWIFSLAAASALVAASCSGGANAVNNDVAATIPLDMNAPRPTAQLVIGNAAPVTAIFDTGAAASVLKRGYAERIGVPNLGNAAAHGPGGRPMQGFRTRIENGRLGGAAFNTAMAVALDIELPLDGVDAIISPGVFSGRLVQFDFPAGVARVLPRTAANIPRGEATPYGGENTHGQIRRTPGVNVELPGVGRVVAVADSGSAGGLTIPLDVARRLPLGPMTPASPIRMVGVEHASFTARVNGVVRVGPITLENPEIRIGDGLAETIVGMEILRGAVLVLDPQEHRSWLLAPPA